jgi:serine/threonine protein kinase
MTDGSVSGAAAGEVIAGYELGAPIACDALGTVYAARRGLAGVAVKIFARAGDRGDGGGAALLLNEVIAAGAMHQPNILEVVDLGQLPDGRPYVATELLEGESLGARLRRVKRLPLADALDFAQQAASALAAAHDAGIVHGALGPEALFLMADLSLPRGERVKVLDFGTRRLIGRGEAPADVYLAPEQRDDAEADPRADVYALGALLYHAVCGVAPQAASGGSLILPRALDRHVPRPLEAAILRALAREPGDRFESMAALTAALQVEAPRQAPPSRPWVRLASVLAGVAIVAAVAWATRTPARTTLLARGRALARSISLPFVSRAAIPARVIRSAAPRRPVILPLHDDGDDALRAAPKRRGRTPPRPR